MGAAERPLRRPGAADDEAQLTAALGPLYAAFDRDAELVTISRCTLQGRAMRRAANARRGAAFRQATSEATQGLSEREAVMATAVIQLLHGGQAWIEMREQWGLAGEESARACAWAIRTLLKDLHRRKGRPLED